MIPTRRFKGTSVLLRYAAALLILCTLLSASLPVPNVNAEEKTTDNVLDNLQDEYDELEQKIAQSEQNLQTIESGKIEQKKNISALETQISDLNSQIDVLENRIDVLDSDIRKLNVSINTLNTQIKKLNTEIDETESLVYETQRSIDLVSNKIHSRLLISYMSGSASKLELLVGSKNLSTLFTRFQIINNISEYDSALIKDFSDQLERLDELNAMLNSDLSELKEKKAKLSGNQDMLFTRQADIESSAYVLKMKKQLNQYKYSEATAYFKTLDKSSSDYSAMLKLFSDEQQKIDNKMNNYLLQYGSSADDVETATNEAATQTTKKKKATQTFTTVAYVPQTIGSMFTTKAPTTTTTANNDLTVPTTKINVVTSSADLIWPVPYRNCYISAYYGTYPSGGIHRGLDICVRGGTEGKNIVAAGNGRVIRYGFNHWSMGNYIIIDHGVGLFTAYYHLKTLYVEEGDIVAQGQVIGLAGSTGNTTGPHLHFEVRISKNGTIKHTDPLKWVSMPS